MTGQVRFVHPSSSGVATVRVVVEDVSELDVPSTVVAEQVVPAIRLPPSEPVRFAVTAELDPRRSYSVRVHADLTGDARVTPGDFVSVRSYPVGTGHEEPLVVDLREVGD